MGLLDLPEEHECPTPLEQAVASFQPGDQFLSPARRWETVRQVIRESVFYVRVTTDALGEGGYGWRFSRVKKFPHIAGWKLARPTFIFVNDSRADGAVIEAFIGIEDGYTDTHVLVSASRQGTRGPEWVVVDYPTAGQPRRSQVNGKAAARSLVRRLAKEHSRNLNVPMWTGDGAR